MENLLGLSSQALLVGISATRLAVAFLLIPVFAQDTVPPLVRNSIFLTFAIITLALQPALSLAGLDAAGWVRIFIKEAFIGMAIGFFFSTMLWAVEMAGQIIDTKAGTNMAQVVDPLSGHQTSLNGEFLSRLANFIFMFSGGFLLLIGTLLDSYSVWPIASDWPDLRRAGVILFEAEFGRLLILALMFAAPALVILFAVDAGLGLINRYAQQLNVFSLSMAIKAWLSTLIVILMLASIVERLTNEFISRPGEIGSILKRLFGG
jgi:type III secretion protein T